ncbi:MAG TPA: tetratricopeptide repeat protein [Thermoanaerobaculia bacterium]
MKHYNEDELARYAFDPDAFDARTELEQHLPECADCRETVEFIRTLDGALSEETPWDVATGLETSQPLPQSLANLAGAIHHEQVSARENLTPLLDSIEHFQAARIPNDPTFQTSGVVRVLADAAEKLRQREPLFALALADAGIAIGTKLKREGALRTASYLGDVWKERAVALGMMGRFREAEDAATQSETHYKSDPHATEHDLAVLQIVRANICVETDRLPEAEQLAAAAAFRFQSFGDTERYLNARVLQGNVSYTRREYKDAAAIYEDLIPIARKGDYTVVLARALANAGESRACLGDYDKARKHFTESCALWQQLGHETDRVRANWSLSNILLNTGNLDAAIDGFAEVHREYEALGIINDAALARLQLAETLLLAERASEVPAVLDRVVMSFSAEGLTRNANMALAYIREAAAANELEPELIRDVRLYLEELPFSPDRIFSR